MVSAHEDTVQTRCWRHTSPFYHLCTQNDRRTKPIYYKVAGTIFWQFWHEGPSAHEFWTSRDKGDVFS